jgi:putative addiction module component (TIGR02574 family)
MAASEGVVIDIDGLSREEKLALIERLWDSLTSIPEDFPVWDWQRELLDRRLAGFEHDRDLGTPAEEVLSRLRGRHE